MTLKLFFFFSSVFLLITGGILFADDEHFIKSVDDILAEIRVQQNVQENTAIRPEMVSNDLLEKLGEAVMNMAQPNEQQHEWMDNMMGGEGSESLRTAHIRMGYNYLLRKTGSSRSFPRGMMDNRYSMMPMMRRWGAHGRDWIGFSFYPFGIIIIVVLVLGASTSLVIFLVKQRRSEGIPIIELKLRLAKGEITIEEFKKIKEQL